MVSMSLSHIFNPKIVDDEDKHDRLPLVAPEARHCGTLVIPMAGKAFGEEVVGQFAGLWQAVDAFSDFEVDPVVVVYNCRKVVLISEFCRDVSQLDVGIFWSVQRRAKVEVLEIKALISSARV